MRRFFVFAAVAISGFGLLARAQQDEVKVVQTDQPMTADQLAIYRTVLHSWMDNGKAAIHLSMRTMPFYLSDMDKDCGSEWHFVAGSSGEVHRFRAADLPLIGSKKIELVDAEKQMDEVKKNDPHTNIYKGKSIGDAVENGFAHGLAQLGEIRFDESHTHAIVSYDFSCGRLCGNGSTVILEKKNGKWVLKSHCSVSMAMFDGLWAWPKSARFAPLG
jgi:hypothetical protein